MTHNTEYVWLIEENVRAEMVNRGAYVSTVEYRLEGNKYITVVDNDEFNEIRRELDDDDNDEG